MAKKNGKTSEASKDDPNSPAACAGKRVRRRPATAGGSAVRRSARMSSAKRERQAAAVVEAVAPLGADLHRRDKTLEATINGKRSKVPITRKFFGDDALVERAIVTLASERALLLVGDPGTGKSWLSSTWRRRSRGNSTLTIQGTAGTTEEHIKYSWNIARSSPRAPAREHDSLAHDDGDARRFLRFEEMTRCVARRAGCAGVDLFRQGDRDPRAAGCEQVFARPGFNIIATANSRDQGVNELPPRSSGASTTCTSRWSPTRRPRSRSSATVQELTRSDTDSAPHRARILNFWQPCSVRCATARPARASASRNPDDALHRRGRSGWPSMPPCTASYFGDRPGGPGRHRPQPRRVDRQRGPRTTWRCSKSTRPLSPRSAAIGDPHWKGFHDERPPLLK